VARQTVNLQVANRIQPNPKYKLAAIGIVDHIFGKNYYNRSYVTGLGINPPMFPHDRRSGADNIKAPWPGYLVGGGHSATDWVDKQESYSHNEIAINWQAALVYALAGFVSF
jgi:endoglucanase